jgi:hypothetical protein
MWARVAKEMAADQSECATVTRGTSFLSQHFASPTMNLYAISESPTMIGRSSLCLMPNRSAPTNEQSSAQLLVVEAKNLECVSVVIVLVSEFQNLATKAAAEGPPLEGRAPPSKYM